jgi:small subunit ribosomal protein S16
MLRIRLRRMGLKGQPTYRVVVTDQRKSRNGAYLEVVGFHNPRTRPQTDEINEARTLYWLSVGAQPSDAARSILNRTGTLARFERLRKGEKLEDLAQEAETAKSNAAPVSPKTSYPAPVGKAPVPAPTEAEEA